MVQWSPPKVTLQTVNVRIKPRGDINAVASNQLGGPDCDTAVSGKVVCIRDDLEKLQRTGYKL